MSRVSTNQVIERLNIAHDYKFSYPFIYDEHISVSSEITVRCPAHGDFVRRIDSMINGGHGCKKCWIERFTISKRLLPDQVIGDLKAIHGDKYDFPYVEKEYTNCDSLITGVCKDHGIFHVRFRSLKYKQTGCPVCGRIKQTISKRNIPSRNGLSLYDRYVNELPITDGLVKGSEGELLVTCKMCRKLMIPTIYQILIRIRAINTIGQGEGNFYCSDKCKSECTVFNVKSDNRAINGKNYDAEVKLARNCQQTSRYVLRQNQLDQYGYHFCEKCGKRVDNLELHHTIEVAKDPLGSINTAGHMLVCRECHNEFTTNCK